MSTRKTAKEVLEKKLGPPTFGGYLIGMRTMKDMTQVEMAKYLNVSKSTLCDIEKGRQFVSIDLAVKIARKCNYPEFIVVKIVLQEMVQRSGLKLQVDVKKAS